MIIDSSALVAILTGEPEAPRFLDDLAKPERKLISVFNWLETAMVIEARKGPLGTKALTQLVAIAGIETIPLDQSQVEVALDAWRRYGKGRHPAGLNIGDCTAYALARVSNQPLLFKSNDFSQTDLAEYN